MSQTPTPEEVSAYVDAVAERVGLPIAPAHRPGVIQVMSGLLGSAALVMEFPLPESAEPAPVFDP